MSQLKDFRKPLTKACKDLMTADVSFLFIAADKPDLEDGTSSFACNGTQEDLCTLIATQMAVKPEFAAIIHIATKMYKLFKQDANDELSKKKIDGPEN